MVGAEHEEIVVSMLYACCLGMAEARDRDEVRFVGLIDTMRMRASTMNVPYIVSSHARDRGIRASV